MTDKRRYLMSRRVMSFFTVCFLTLFVSAVQSQNPVALKQGAKVFVAPMPDGFDTYLKGAFEKKKVPLTIVASRDDADFEMTGTSETQKAGTAKKLIMLNWHSDEEASVSITSRKTGEVVFAYSVNKPSSAHGKQSTAEACAVHIKDELKKKK